MTTGALQRDDNNQTGALTGPQQQAVEANPEPEVVTPPEPVANSPEDKKNFIGRMVSKGKEFWERGKDDPATEAREDKTEQVTSFMGGMTRQELGMFVFQWGGMMMANSDKGLGAAAGEAGLGALAGHQGRQTAAQEKEESKAQQIIENRLAQQKADADTKTADATMKRAEAYESGLNTPRGGVGEWKYALYKSIGWSDEKIAQALEGIMTTEQIYDEVSTSFRDEKASVARAEKMSTLPDNMRAQTYLPDGTSVPTAKLTEAHIKLLATEAAKVQVEARGALNPRPQPPNAEDAFSAAMDKHGNYIP